MEPSLASLWPWLLPSKEVSSLLSATRQTRLFKLTGKQMQGLKPEGDICLSDVHAAAMLAGCQETHVLGSTARATMPINSQGELAGSLLGDMSFTGVGPVW